jgi:hypothetical protein
MPNALALIPEAADVALETHPDTPRFKCRFDIGSASSSRIYRVSYDAAPGAGYWTCSCPGNIRHGHCKHLEAMGLPGRKQKRTLAAKEWRRRLA